MSVDNYRLIATLSSKTAIQGCLSFSPSGNILASYSRGRRILLSDTRDGEGIIYINICNILRVLTWNPAEQQELVCGSEDGIVVVLRLRESRDTCSTVALRFGESPVTQLAVRKSKPVIAASGDVGIVRLWERSSTQWTQRLTPLPSVICLSEANIGLEFVGNTATLLLSRSNHILGWDVDSGQIVVDYSLESYTLCTHTRIVSEPLEVNDPYLIVFCKPEMFISELTVTDPARKKAIGSRTIPLRSSFLPSVSNPAARPTLIYGGVRGMIHMMDLWSGKSLGSVSHSMHEDVDTAAIFFNQDTDVTLVATSVSSRSDPGSSGSIKIWKRVTHLEQSPPRLIECRFIENDNDDTFAKSDIGKGKAPDFKAATPVPSGPETGGSSMPMLATKPHVLSVYLPQGPRVSAFTLFSLAALVFILAIPMGIIQSACRMSSLTVYPIVRFWRQTKPIIEDELCKACEHACKGSS